MTQQEKSTGHVVRLVRNPTKSGEGDVRMTLDGSTVQMWQDGDATQPKDLTKGKVKGSLFAPIALPDGLGELRMTLGRNGYGPSIDPSVSAIRLRITVEGIERGTPAAGAASGSDGGAILAALISGGDVDALAEYVKATTPGLKTMKVAKVVAAGMIAKAATA